MERSPFHVSVLDARAAQYGGASDGPLASSSHSGPRAEPYQVGDLDPALLVAFWGDTERRLVDGAPNVDLRMGGGENHRTA